MTRARCPTCWLTWPTWSAGRGTGRQPNATRHEAGRRASKSVTVSGGDDLRRAGAHRRGPGTHRRGQGCSGKACPSPPQPGTTGRHDAGWRAWFGGTVGRVLGAAEGAAAAVGLAGRIGLAEPAAWRFHANHVEIVIGLVDLDRAEVLLTWLERQGRATARRWTLATGARRRAPCRPRRYPRCRPGTRRSLGRPPAPGDVLEHAPTLLVSVQTQRRAKRKRIAGQLLDHALVSSSPCPPRHGRRAPARSFPASGFARWRCSS